MARASDPRPWEEILESIARKIADWPDPEDTEVRSALDEALAGTAPSVRRRNR
jgi:hypothetical protein